MLEKDHKLTFAKGPPSNVRKYHDFCVKMRVTRVAFNRPIRRKNASAPFIAIVHISYIKKN